MAKLPPQEGQDFIHKAWHLEYIQWEGADKK